MNLKAVQIMYKQDYEIKETVCTSQSVTSANLFIRGGQFKQA